ncbi:hypothetical protein I4F81_004989 [Pyropia yezoensis]|uniref:Uncharacterized protein n=1 Tax=Pyropia yezoensis TaxID=2788 RepID=A0ACC3BXE8_PYRYE|nr:hypothetical protein I4F81_004989 [Neopyropia yezoensis]
MGRGGLAIPPCPLPPPTPAWRRGAEGPPLLPCGAWFLGGFECAALTHRVLPAEGGAAVLLAPRVYRLDWRVAVLPLPLLPPLALAARWQLCPCRRRSTVVPSWRAGVTPFRPLHRLAGAPPPLLEDRRRDRGRPVPGRQRSLACPAPLSSPRFVARSLSGAFWLVCALGCSPLLVCFLL